MRPLEYRLGFPSAENLRCPMFSQNKWNSLSCVKDRINFTLPIAMPEELRKLYVTLGQTSGGFKGHFPEGKRHRCWGVR